MNENLLAGMERMEVAAIESCSRCFHHVRAFGHGSVVVLHKRVGG